MSKDLRAYLRQLEKAYPDQIVRVTRPVDSDQQPAALLARMESGERAPVIIFERVGDASMPVVVNCHGTRDRLALALGATPETLHETYGERLRNPIQPQRVETGPVKEIVVTGDEVDINRLPVIRPSANCPGAYIGGGILAAKDPASGIHNLSFNRLMIQGPRQLGFHAAPGLHLHTICAHAKERSEELPVAIVIGYHPAFALGTLAKIPLAADEYDYASAMLHEPVPLVKCETSDLEVPANAEMILEGKVLLGVRCFEGPYDEFTGYAMARQLQPVIQLTAITRRADAMFQDIFGGTREHLVMGSIPKESSLLLKLRETFPWVRDIHFPYSGGGRMHAVIAVERHAANRVKELIRAAFSFDHFLKHIFVVDGDVDIRRDEQVLQALATCFQGASDMVVLKNQLGSSLDPSASSSAFGSKVGFDCTRKQLNFPIRNAIDSHVLNVMNPKDYLCT